MNIITKIIQTGGGKRKFPSPAVFALVVAGMAGSMLTATAAQVGNLYKTSFEQSTFQPGFSLSGLDGWTTALPPFLNPTVAKIVNTAAKSGKQSVEVRGNELISSEGITAPYDAVGISRRPLEQNGNPGYTLTGSERFARVDADLQLETTKPKTTDEFFSLTISARSGDGETLGEIGLSSQGVVEAWDFGSSPGSAPKFNQTTIRLNKWYHITMLLDFDQHTTTYYIDEHSLGRILTPSTSRTLLRGAIGVFRRPDNAVNVSSDYIARFDNFRISVHSVTPDIN